LDIPCQLKKLRRGRTQLQALSDAFVLGCASRNRACPADEDWVELRCRRPGPHPGAFVGLAATGGFLLNTAFLLAGTTSTNPVLAVLGILMILGWKNAGYLGPDHYLLSALGMPWSREKLNKPAALMARPVVARL
jgi:hypothetical protein